VIDFIIFIHFCLPSYSLLAGTADKCVFLYTFARFKMNARLKISIGQEELLTFCFSYGLHAPEREKFPVQKRKIPVRNA
jgi:hypothetical protein